MYKVAYATTGKLESIKYNNGIIESIATPSCVLFIDGRTAKEGELVLVKDQASPQQNGIYKLTDEIPFKLKRKFDLTKKKTAHIVVLSGDTQTGKEYSLVRKTRKPDIINFDEIVHPKQTPIIEDKEYDKDDETEMEVKARSPRRPKIERQFKQLIKEVTDEDLAKLDSIEHDIQSIQTKLQEVEDRTKKQNLAILSENEDIAKQLDKIVDKLDTTHVKVDDAYVVITEQIGNIAELKTQVQDIKQQLATLNYRLDKASVKLEI